MLGLTDGQINTGLTALGGVLVALIGYVNGKRSKDTDKSIATEKNLWERVKVLESRLDRQHQECDERIDALEREVESLRQKNYELQAKIYQLEHPQTERYNEPHAG